MISEIDRQSAAIIIKVREEKLNYLNKLKQNPALWNSKNINFKISTGTFTAPSVTVFKTVAEFKIPDPTIFEEIKKKSGQADCPENIQNMNWSEKMMKDVIINNKILTLKTNGYGYLDIPLITSDQNKISWTFKINFRYDKTVLNYS